MAIKTWLIIFLLMKSMTALTIAESVRRFCEVLEHLTTSRSNGKNDTTSE